jgi:ubiquinone/menaquinone biosynthesis C-methylase UbiE
MIKKFKIFESSAIWDDYINKINTGILPKDKPDIITIDKLSNLIPAKSKILDISIGDGANTEYFIEKGYDVYGTDISQLAIETISEKYPEYTWIEHDTLEKFPFSNNQFNLVFARLAIHYFDKKSIDKILNDINRILKNNGYLYILVKISNTGNLSTGKVSYSSDEWKEMVSEYFEIFDYKEEIKKAYSYEKEPSNLLEIIGKK